MGALPDPEIFVVSQDASQTNVIKRYRSDASPTLGISIPTVNYYPIVPSPRAIGRDKNIAEFVLAWSVIVILSNELEYCAASVAACFLNSHILDTRTSPTESLIAACHDQKIAI